MIHIGNAAEADKDKYDENWMIVRKPEELPDFVRHEPLLSPSPELFRKYRDAFHAGQFDGRFFHEIYVPQFLEELAANLPAMELMYELADTSREKEILLACYCEDEKLCHRSIIAGVLLGLGAEIETDPDYISYYRMLAGDQRGSVKN